MGRNEERREEGERGKGPQFGSGRERERGAAKFKRKGFLPFFLPLSTEGDEIDLGKKQEEEEEEEEEEELSLRGIQSVSKRASAAMMPSQRQARSATMTTGVSAAGMARGRSVFWRSNLPLSGPNLDLSRWESEM